MPGRATDPPGIVALAEANKYSVFSARSEAGRGNSRNAVDVVNSTSEHGLEGVRKVGIHHKQNAELCSRRSFRADKHLAARGLAKQAVRRGNHVHNVLSAASLRASEAKRLNVGVNKNVKASGKPTGKTLDIAVSGRSPYSAEPDQTTETLDQLTGHEVDDALSAVTLLLDGEVSRRIADKLLMAKLSSLLVGLRAERAERRAMSKR
jgi:hypothetical protein